MSNSDLCSQCKSAKIDYWCLDGFCKRNLLCGNCIYAHNNVEDVSSQEKIKLLYNKMIIWTERNLLKIIMMISERTYNYSKQIQEQFKQIDQKQNFFSTYSQYIKNKTRIEQAFINLNNELSKCQFPESNIQQADYQEKLKQCKKLINEKQINQALNLSKSFNLQDQTYFKIQCLIQQKNLKEALTQSRQLLEVNSSKNNNEFYYNLLLQQAKIYHKMGHYLQALHTLENIKKEKEKEKEKEKGKHSQQQERQKYENLSEEQKKQEEEKEKLRKHLQKRVDLQISKTLMKSGFFQMGLNQLMLITKASEIQNQQTYLDYLKIDEENLNDNYSLDDFSFSLTFAKAQMMKCRHSIYDYEEREQQIQLSQSNVQDENVQMNQSFQNEQYVRSITIPTLDNIIVLYNQILEQDPSNQKALYGLSQTYSKQTQFKKARDILYKLYQLNPMYLKAEIGILFCKQKLRENEEIDLVQQLGPVEKCLSGVFSCLNQIHYQCSKICFYKN